MQGHDSVWGSMCSYQRKPAVGTKQVGGVVAGVGEGCWVQASPSTPGSREGVTPKLSPRRDQMRDYPKGLGVRLDLE